MKRIISKRVCFFYLLCFIMSHFLIAEEREGSFKMSPLADSVIIPLALGSFAASLFIPEVGGTPVQEDQINSFDRPFRFPYNHGVDMCGTLLSVSCLMLPVIPAIGFRKNFSALGTYVLMYSEAFLLTHGVKNILKQRVYRQRPGMYTSGSEMDDPYDSFPSGHTAYAFMGATFLAVALAEEVPDRSWRKPLVYSGYAVAAIVAGLRVASGEHFLSDVLAGAAIGSFFGWLVPYVHQNPVKDQTVAVQPMMSTNGIALSLRF
jgi:undecaprenyl-diphosphatase